MTDLTSVIAELTAPLIHKDAAGKPTNTTNFALQHVLAAVTAREAEIIRRCAIPRRFDQDTFTTLQEPASDLSQLFQWITSYSFIRKVSDRHYAYHEEIRKNLLKEWKEQRPQDFHQFNAQLADYFDSLAANIGHGRENDTFQEQSNRELWETEALYHHLIVDPQKGEEKLQERIAQEERKENQGRTEVLLRAEQDATVDDYELFRKAIVLRDDNAWLEIAQRYHDLLLSWAKRYSTYTYIQDSPADIADRALARAWTALSRERFVSFTTVSSLLAYLRTCISATVIDISRAQRSQDRLYQQLNDLEIVDPEERVIQSALQEEVWQVTSNLLSNNQERTVIIETFLLNLPPRIITSRHPELFSSVSDVYSVKRNALGRLERSEYLKRIFDSLKD